MWPLPVLTVAEGSMIPVSVASMVLSKATTTGFVAPSLLHLVMISYLYSTIYLVGFMQLFYSLYYRFDITSAWFKVRNGKICPALPHWVASKEQAPDFLRLHTICRTGFSLFACDFFFINQAPLSASKSVMQEKTVYCTPASRSPAIGSCVWPIII